MAGIEFRDVAALLTCREFAATCGMRIQGGRLQCPFHGGHNFNCALVNGGRRVYCYKCGRSGDVVTLAAAVWHTDQRSAAEELNERFKLGLAGQTVTPAERERREQERREAREQAEQAKRAEVQEWSKACDDERAAEAALRRFTEADADSAEFDQALRRLGQARMRADVLDACTGRRL